MTNIPLVAIKCLTFNHENYIRRTLDGFVSQRTNFRFVVVIHDDASTDGTIDIIKEYAARYPDIIKPIFEVENQYSKRDGSLSRIVNDALYKTGSKYIAWCEGDDYWCDPNKLQLQVDIMEKDSSISLCYTRIRCYNEEKKKFTGYFEPDCHDFRTFLKYDRTITLSSIYRSEYFFDYLDEIQPDSKKWMMGDTPLWLYLCKRGNIVALHEVTGVYNAHMGSVSRQSSIEKMKAFNKSALDIRLFFINKYDDCHDLEPFLLDKYYRSNFQDAYNFRNFNELLKNFHMIKCKVLADYKLLVRIIPACIHDFFNSI